MHGNTWDSLGIVQSDIFKGIQFTFINDKEKQKILPFEKLEPENVSPNVLLEK